MLINSEQEALIGLVFETYLTEHHHGDILQLIADANEETHHPVLVNAMTLFETNMEVGDYFNAYPNDVLAIFDKVLQRTAMDLSQNASLKHFEGQRTKEHRMRNTLHARITGLPVCPELTRETIPRSRDVGHFLSVTGTIIRTSVAKADFDQFYASVPPVNCPNPDGCNSYKFSCLSGGSEPSACKDYQEIKIQEQVQRLSVGSIPRSMVVVLEDDLVDSCKSGDDVTVYGVMCQRWKPLYEGTRSDVEMVLKANNIEVNNKQTASALLMKDVLQEFAVFWDNYKHDPIAGRNQILLSLCPQVFGMYVIKLAVAMVLAGGVQRIDSSGTKIRGECHMLLVGDPGTGKSQFLKYAAKIMPRSVLTAGIGSTSAGLTVAAVKDGGDWHLEAGALVLSDGGLCCIDEFNSIKEHDRISIHEAMEQQSISVAKAGMVCKLNTRCTILAATNPKGQYNPNEPLSVNIALASPLLSRFDLVLVLLDTRNAEWDHTISSFILEDRGLAAESSSLWPMDKMKAYFCAIKHLQPQVSDEANSILTRYYQLQRQSDGRNAARTTIRMLESLSRLAEAHARLMYRETVTIEDAVMAVSVMECSMQGGALLGNVNALLTSFPEDPGQQYEAQSQVLLEGLNLPLLLQKEMDRLARLKSYTSNASKFDSHTAHYQRHPRDTNTQNQTHVHGMTSVYKGDATVESGLDWFHSITSSGSPDDLTPTLTSTQENLNRKLNSMGAETTTAIKQRTCQIEEDYQKNIGSTLTHEGTVTTSKEENEKTEKNEYIKEKSSVCQEVHQPERQKDEQHSESLGCVFQRVTKNLRDRRLGEQESNNLQCNKVEGRGHGDSVVFSDSKGKNVNHVLNANPDSQRSTIMSLSKNLPSNYLMQKNQSCGKQRRFEKEDKINQTETKNICTAQGENISSEADKTKELLNFTLHHNSTAISNVSAKFQTEDNLGSRGLHDYTGSRIGRQKLVGHDELARPSTDTEKIERKKNLNQFQSLVQGRCSRKSEVAECWSEDSTCFTSVELDRNVFSLGKEISAQGKGVGRIKKSNDSENLCQQQRTRDNNSDMTIEDDFTGSPHLNTSTQFNDSTPFHPGHTKSSIPSSTLAKLSRFSFTCTTKPTTTAPMQVEINPPTEEEKGLFKRKQGRESPTRTNFKAKQRETVHAAKRVMNGDLEYESTVNVKKRRCFKMGPPPSIVHDSKGAFSGLSLFDSVEISNDVLDTDWDQEFSNRGNL
ncbi:DNA helicase MCM9 isoform X2 [Pleuronectes platessa]|uniref:DNA helicase MCM9 isoform X2 n=1 Tax=Pleuronectes platessa TaxID=8262 RepID=UPI00232A140A|nr:DNA helicase MCM9 isoform X2 [Pleuronectes platessa]